jgi:hypothetical protein
MDYPFEAWIAAIVAASPLSPGAIVTVPGAERSGHALVVTSHREGRIGTQHGVDAIHVSGIDRREQIVGCPCHRDTFSLSSLFA